MRVAGLISGTSVDGIDVAVVDIGEGIQVVSTVTISYPPEVRTAILSISNAATHTGTIARLNFLLGELFAEALQKTGVPYTIEFHASDRTRRITFNLARNLDFFAGQSAESTALPVKISLRTLAYINDHLNNQFTYTAPPGPDFEEITSVFEQLSETLEFGRRLAYLHEQNPKSVGAELQSLQKLVDRHQIREFQALAGVLRGVASDQRLDASTRDHAGTLLQLAERWR